MSLTLLLLLLLVQILPVVIQLLLRVDPGLALLALRRLLLLLLLLVLVVVVVVVTPGPLIVGARANRDLLVRLALGSNSGGGYSHNAGGGRTASGEPWPNLVWSSRFNNTGGGERVSPRWPRAWKTAASTVRGNAERGTS